MSKEEIKQLLLRFKTVLLDVATYYQGDSYEYEKLRESIINIPELQGQIPSDILINYTADEFRSLMQTKGGYKDRRDCISKMMNGMLLSLDGIQEIKPNKLFDVFISHSSKDKELAEYLVNFLINIGVDRNKIFFSSISEMGVSKSIRQDIKEALHSSKFYFIIMSNNYLSSPFCLNEEGAIWYISDNYIVFADAGFNYNALSGFINNDCPLRSFSKKDDYIKAYEIMNSVLELNANKIIVDNAASEAANKFCSTYSSDVFPELNKRETELYLILKNNPNYRIDDIAKIMNISRNTLLVLINNLINEKYVEKQYVDGKRLVWKCLK